MKDVENVVNQQTCWTVLRSREQGSFLGVLMLDWLCWGWCRSWEPAVKIGKEWLKSLHYICVWLQRHCVAVCGWSVEVLLYLASSGLLRPQMTVCCFTHSHTALCSLTLPYAASHSLIQPHTALCSLTLPYTASYSLTQPHILSHIFM